MEDAIARRDSQRLERSAHSLKGSAAYLAIPAVSDAAQELETMGREGHLDGVEEAYATLQEEIERLKPALAAFVEEDAG